MKKGGIGGGNTKTGIFFEKETDLASLLNKQPGYDVRDDDEYPMACELNDNKIKWIKQNNVATHLRYIKDANITFGYRCGYNSPVPHIDFSSKAEEKNFANFIDDVF